MKRQPTWDKYEVALLIDAYNNIKSGLGSKLNVLQELSNNLRGKAINEGLIIDETFRNLNGMQWQIGFINCAFKKSGYGSHMPSKLFQEMVDMYLNDRKRFEEILTIAKSKVSQLSKDNEYNILENREDKMGSQKEKFIKWMKNKTDLKYPEASIIRVIDECSKYAVMHKHSKITFWDIESAKLFEIVSSKLLNDRIFIVIHKNTAQAFIKSRGYYKEFLDEGRCAEVTKRANTPVIKKKCIEKEDGSEKYVDRLIQIIAKNFVYGFRLDSPIELMKLKEYAKEAFLDFDKSDEEIENLICKRGFVINNKLFVVTDEVKTKLNGVLDRAFTQGNAVIYYECFMEKHREWLEEIHIVSEGVLKELLVKTRDDLVFSKNYMSNKEKNTEEIWVVTEICRVWNQETILSVEEISNRLPYIPMEKIRFYLSMSKLFVWVSEGVYTRIEKLVITEEEEKDILEFINKECEEKGFASLSNMPLGDIVEQNYELSKNAILISVYNKYLSDNFCLDGKIVTRPGSDIDITLLLSQFCAEKNECTLVEAVETVSKLTGTKARRVAYPVLYDVMVRVDEQRFVADRLVDFDVDAIDDAIKPFVKDGFVAIKEITTFAVFPICGQSWSHYLLESYCYRFSRKYKYQTNLFNERNAGAIVAVSIDWDYKELLSRAVARANIKLEKEIIGQYLFETGYMAKRKFSWLDAIVERAKHIREENA